MEGPPDQWQCQSVIEFRAGEVVQERAELGSRGYPQSWGTVLR